ncbi:YIP1 family protein [Halobacterium jilantaiense]|uniref:Yip1 domain-containing protein n=1 Tax=Halobacterium jilantaiense TaxID=355548 RepID=A0A1I0P110_9EURY|nr:YIP1 family protein [Halobacterium jilantaiense]SEW07638.1 hypothetical protein SAMN04487945_1298 [Halobacterium jilantaiense]
MAPRTPILHPVAYFESRGFDLWPAAVAVGVATLSLTLALAGFGVLLSDKLAAAGHGDASGAVWSVLVSYLVVVVVAMVVGWLLAAGILHLLARAVVGHDGRFGETLTVVGWGTAPTLLTSLVAFVILALALDGTTLSSPEAFARQFRANVQSGSALSHALSFLVACWQTFLYGRGLAVAFDDDSGTTWLVGGVVAFGGWLLALF